MQYVCSIVQRSVEITYAKQATVDTMLRTDFISDSVQGVFSFYDVFQFSFLSFTIPSSVVSAHNLTPLKRSD